MKTKILEAIIIFAMIGTIGIEFFKYGITKILFWMIITLGWIIIGIRWKNLLEKLEDSKV